MRLPNRAFITTNFSATFFFNNFSYLLDVLYIPNFYINLICVPKLTNSINYNITFNSTTCLIHENQTLMKIGAPVLYNGLYLLTHHSTHNHKISKTHSNFTKLNMTICDLWPNRFGHPSSKTIDNINNNLPLPHFSKHHFPF